MNITSAQGMADILPPEAPTISLWVHAPTVIAVLIVLLIIGFIWLRREPRTTLRRLKSLLNQHQTEKIEASQVAFMLAAELRQIFQLAHVNALYAPQSIEPRAWGDFIDRLQSVRFSPHGNAEETLTTLILQTQQWVAQHGR